MRDCTVYLDGEAAGRLFRYQDGLYWQFDAVLTAYDGLRRLIAADEAGNRLSLGIPLPEGGRMRLRRRISGTQLRYAGFHPDALQDAELLPASDGTSPTQPKCVSDAGEASTCPDGTAAGRIVCRESPPALLEPFETGKPLSLAAWYRSLTLETQGNSRFAVLPLGKNRCPEE